MTDKNGKELKVGDYAWFSIEKIETKYDKILIKLTKDNSTNYDCLYSLGETLRKGVARPEYCTLATLDEVLIYKLER